MKRLTGLILFSALTVVALSQKPVYTITGKIDGAEGVQFILQKPVGGSLVDLSSAVVSNGTFVIKGGSVEYPETAYLVTGDRKNRISFLLENSNITITGSLSSLSSAKITGSKTQDDINLLSEKMQPVIQKYNTKNSEYQTAKNAGNNELAVRLSKEINDIAVEADQIQKDFITSHPASFATPLVIESMASSLSAKELETIINSLDPAVARTPVIVNLKSRLEVLKRVEIGQKAPDFIMNDPKGKPVSLSSLLGKNILLVDFWAAWCGPCRAENPNVVKVFNEFKDKGFNILGVSLDQAANDWTRAINDDKLTWTHVSDLKYWNNAAARLYGVNSIPANFLLDRNGVIIARNLRGDDLYNKVKELLGGK
jgi:peroxiredoxin